MVFFCQMHTFGVHTFGVVICVMGLGASAHGHPQYPEEWIIMVYIHCLCLAMCVVAKRNMQKSYKLHWN